MPVPRLCSLLFIFISFFLHATHGDAADSCRGLLRTATLCKLVGSENNAAEEGNIPARAAGAISAYLAIRDKDGNFPPGALEQALIPLLPDEARDACNRSVEAAKADGVLYAEIACFRPVCASETRSQVAECGPLQSLVGEPYRNLRAAFASGSTCNAGKQCITVSTEAVELILAADSLKGLVKELSPQSCSLETELCTQRLLQTLERIVETYQEAAKLHYVLTTIAETPLAGAIGLDASASLVSDFNKAWAIVSSSTVKLKRDEISTLFMLAPEVRRALAHVADPANRVRVHIEKEVNAERLEVARQLLMKGAELLRTESKDGELQNFKRAWVAAGYDKTLTTEVSASAAASIISEFAGKIDDEIWKLRATAPPSPETGVSTPGSNPAAPCSKAGTFVDHSTGKLDFCFTGATSAAAYSIIGMRYDFVPCASQAESVGCETKGALHLMIKGPSKSDAPPSVIVSSLGAQEILGRIDATSIDTEKPVLRLIGTPPAYTYVQSPGDLKPLLEQFLPAPFLTGVEGMDLSDGPILDVKFRVWLNVFGKTKSSALTIRFAPGGATIASRAITDNIQEIVADLTKPSVKGLILQSGSLDLTVEGMEHVASGASDGCLDRNARSLRLDVSAETNIGAPILGELHSCGSNFKLKFDLNQPKLLTALAGKFQIPPENVQFYAREDRLFASLKLITDDCTHRFDLDIKSVSIDTFQQMGQNLVLNAAQCQAPRIIADQAPAVLKALGFRETVQRGTYCTDQIIDIGAICVLQSTSNATGFALKEDLHLKDRLSAKLQGLIGAKADVHDLRFAQDGVVIRCSIELPVIGRLENLELVVGPQGLSTDVVAAIREAVLAKSSQMLLGKTFTFAELEVSNLNVLSEGGSSLVVRGTVSYGNIPGGLKIQLLPKVKIEPDLPDANGLLALLQKAFGSIGAVKSPTIFIGNDGIPVFKATVTVSLPFVDLPIKASAGLSARAGQPIRFDGPVSFVVPGWYPLSFFELGRLRASVDLNRPFDRISVGASLAMPKGDATYDVAGLDADFTIARQQIDLIGSLALLKIPLGQAKGVWKLKEGMLEVDVGAGKAEGIIPLPTGHLTVDGPACAIVGSGSAKLLGAKLAEARAGFFLGAPCNASPAKNALVASLIEECGGRGPVGQICLRGQVGFGKIAGADGLFSSRLDQFVPRISGKIDLAGLATFDVNISSMQVALRTRVLGFRLGVILPSVDGLDEEFLRQLIANLLKPSIDLSALLRGDVTIAPASKGGKGDGATVGGGTPGTDQVQQGPGKGNPGGGPAPSVPNNSSSNYKWRQGTAIWTVQQVPGTDLWQVIESGNGASFPVFPYAFSHQDAIDISSGEKGIPKGRPKFSIAEKQFLVGCTTLPCDPDKLKAVRAYAVGAQGDTSPSTATESDLKLSAAEASIQAGNGSILAADAVNDFNFPALVGFLAERVKAARNDEAKLYCVRQDKTCSLTILRTSGRSLLFQRGAENFQEIEEGSIARLAYEKACASGQCVAAPLIDNLDILASTYRVVAKSPLDPSNFPATLLVNRKYRVGIFSVLRVPTPPNVALLKLDPTNLAITAIAPVNLRSNHPSVSFAERPIAHPVLDVLVDAAGSKMEPGSRYEIMYKPPNYAAGADIGPSKAIWSTLLSNDKPCVRTSSWVEISNKLGAWKTDDFVASDYADKLRNASGPAGLLGDLVSPARTEGRFRASPLLLFGDPNKVCVQ